MQRVLLIDDEPRVVESILNLYGYQVEAANNSQLGMARVANTNAPPIDMVIMDVHMSGRASWDSLKKLREQESTRHVPIIVLTTPRDNQEESLVTSLQAGADIYLTKPITPSKLIAHVEAIFRRVHGIKAPVASVAAPASKTPPLASDPVPMRAAMRSLTPRETEILQLLVQGCSNQTIGKKLVISETTVKNHLAHVFKKLNVSNRTQAAFVVQQLDLF